MARRRKHYKGLSTIRFGAFALPTNVNVNHLAYGLGVGLAGALALRYAWNKMPFLAQYKAAAALPGATGVWPVINNNMPAVGAALAAVVAYFVAKRKSPEMAKALAVGAGAFAVTQGAFGVAQSFSPSFKGLQTVAIGGGRYGAMMVSDGMRPFGALMSPSSTARLPGVNVPARVGAMALAQQNPKLGALLAAHQRLAAHSRR